jgi:hypothetical protein
VSTQTARVNTTAGSAAIVGIDPAMTDVFGRLKITRHQAMFDTDLEYGLQPTRWESITGNSLGGSSGTIAHLPNQGGVTLAVPASTNGAYAIRQTKRYFRYQSGKQQYTSAAAQFSFPDAGVINRVGMFDDCNGLFFEQSYADINTTVTAAGNQVNPNGISVVRRSTLNGAVTDTKIKKENWNIDKMDGTGPSKINLDFSKVQMFSIQFAWYGAGVVNFGFYVDGRFIACHQYRHANNLTTVYMRTGNLPARYEIRAITASNAASNLFHWGTSVMTEGGFDQDRGYIYAGSNGVTSKTAITSTRTPLASVRSKSLGTTSVTSATVASGATTSTVPVSGTPWTVDAYAGLFCYPLTGTRANQPMLIVSNTNNTLTLDTSQILYPTAALTAGDTFAIGLINRGGILPTDIDVYTAGAAAYIEVILSGSLTGASWTNIGGTSLSQQDTAATAITVSGSAEVVASYYATAGSITRVDLTGLYPLGMNTKGQSSDTLTVCATAIGGGTISNANATIRFSEAQS